MPLEQAIATPPKPALELVFHLHPPPHKTHDNPHPECLKDEKGLLLRYIAYHVKQELPSALCPHRSTKLTTPLLMDQAYPHVIPFYIINDILQILPHRDLFVTLAYLLG